jgi:hypothetical protein
MELHGYSPADQPLSGLLSWKKIHRLGRGAREIVDVGGYAVRTFW